MVVQTKSSQVERRLRNSILKGKWQPGEKLPPEREILKKFNISRTTLRDALNALANEGMLERRQGAGTFVAKFQTAGNIAVLGKVENMCSPMGYMYRRFIDEVQSLVLPKFRYTMWVGHGSTEEEFVDSIRLLDRPNLNETLGVLATVAVGNLERQLTEAGIHLVSMNVGIPLVEHAVVLDWDAMFQMGCHELESRGYDDFVVMHPEVSENLTPGPMGNYFRTLLDKLVKGDHSRLVSIPYDREYGQAYQAMRDLLRRSPQPRGIFFTDDAVCDVAMRAISSLGLEIPKDLAIVTQSNVGREFHFPVRLSRIEFDPAQIAAEAWGLLSKLISGQSLESNVVYVSPRVVPGQSLG